MVVYGVALLALCLLLGTYLGNVLGYLMGIDANVGGVGIAMLMLIVLSNLSHSKFHLKPMTESGIHFWSAMYIPIVVAMAAKQNVVAALSSGWLAVIAGVGAVVVSFALVPLLTKLGGSDAAPLTDKES